MFNKLIKANDDRTSRLHTEDDIFIGWGNAITQVPIVTFQKVRDKVVGSRPIAPWWPLPAIDAVSDILHKDMRAIEFGSGSSTLWIADRVASVVAHEHNEEWVEVTRKRIADLGVTNATVEHKPDHSYFEIAPDQRFDFAVVDGNYRWKCIEALADKMNPGGFIYFDNSDSDKDAELYQEFDLNEKHHAQRVIKELCEANDSISAKHYHGMIQGELFAGSGMLIHFS